MFCVMHKCQQAEWGTPEGTRLHFRQRRKLRFAAVKPSASNSPPDCCIESFESFLSIYQKSRYPDGYLLFWYTGRDSNPQPSEPESDALSIEPPVHLLHSPIIIARFGSFVKRNFVIPPLISLTDPRFFAAWKKQEPGQVTANRTSFAVSWVRPEDCRQYLSFYLP